MDWNQTSWGATSSSLCPRAIWVFPKMVGKPPKWMVKIMENPIKLDGGKTHYFRKHPYIGCKIGTHTVTQLEVTVK